MQWHEGVFENLVCHFGKGSKRNAIYERGDPTLETMLTVGTQ
jgi:hypothetical protein